MNDEIQTILFEDESMIRDYQAIMKSWFLKNVLKQYPKGKIVMILDNAKIHHAKGLSSKMCKFFIEFCKTAINTGCVWS